MSTSSPKASTLVAKAALAANILNIINGKQLGLVQRLKTSRLPGHFSLVLCTALTNQLGMINETVFRRVFARLQRSEQGLFSS